MSMFTDTPTSQQPKCPRCKSPQFVALINRTDEFTIWDCRKCNSKPQGATGRKR